MCGWEGEKCALHNICKWQPIFLSFFFFSLECKRPIKQLELKIGLLAEKERGSLCLVKCNQSGDKGTISAV